MFYLFQTPWWLRLSYPSCVWEMPVSDKVIHLTFDDGPHETATPFALEHLKAFDAKATFFCIGKNVVRHPELFQRLLQEGHTVGNHTMEHTNGWKVSDDVYVEGFRQADALIHSSLFRPPYGRIKRSQIRSLRKVSPDLRIIMWSLLSGDFDTDIDGQRCYEQVIRYIKPGSIIVFHDSQKALPRLHHALPRLLEWMKEHGYRSEALPMHSL